jgi:anti-sigma B factor antagonist
LEWHVIIRQLDRVSVDAAVLFDRTRGAAGRDGGSDVAVMTAEPEHYGEPAEPYTAELDELQLGLSSRTDEDGFQIVSVTGELDIATAEQAYTYISDAIDALGHGPAPFSIDLSGLTFCDASGLGVLARIARHARQAGRQLRLTSARPALVRIIRITGLDRSFPELVPLARAA